MTDINICMCGAFAGYPHKSYCPYPYFGHNAKDIEAWMKARLELEQLQGKISILPQGKEQENNENNPKT